MTGPEETQAKKDEPKKPEAPVPEELRSNNYFARLGLTPGASDVEIKLAYKSSVKQYHPDTNRDKPIWAEACIKLVNEAYENLRVKPAQSLVREFGHGSRRDRRGPRTPENSETARRAAGLKIEVADVDSFTEGGVIAAKIDQEFKQSDRRDELLGYLTRRLHYLLQQRIKEHTNLEALAVLAKEVNEFADSQQGKLLFTSFFTDELDYAALDIGLDLLSKAKTNSEVDHALTSIAKYPFTFGSITAGPVSEGKDDAMAKIRLLSKVKRVRPRTGDRLDKLIEEVNEYHFNDEKRAPMYKKQIIDIIERHRKIYYRKGVFVPLRVSPSVGRGEER